MEKRLAAYPDASRYDLETARLDVARALAGNTRAMLNVGSGDIASALVMRDLADEGVNGAPAAAAQGRGRRTTSRRG